MRNLNRASVLLLSLLPLTTPLHASEDLNANACLIQCKSDCSDEAAAMYIWCLGPPLEGTTEECTAFAADTRAICVEGCYQQTGTCGTPR